MEGYRDVMTRNSLIEIQKATVVYRKYPSLTNSLKLELLQPRKSRLKSTSVSALKQISLEIGPGEVVGVIGRNGAGKSTLAKLIVGAVRPVSGWVVTRGSISSMIELTAGINTDMSPRENVRLNCAIQQLPLDDIQNRAIRICKNAGVQDLLDIPIRSFSSGMLARFAFSLYTDVSPDILIIDEILSVGDLGFQSYSQNVIKGLIDAGRCVVLISHDLDSILQHSSRVIWLENGTVRQDGLPKNVISEYRKNSMASGE